MTVRPHVRARRTRLLSRAFFGRLFENDLFSSSVSASSSVTWMLAALATPGVMFSGSQMFNYAHVRTFAPEAQDRIFFASQAFHVNFAMAIAGLVTMMVWTSLTPDRLDALVLGPLPSAPASRPARGWRRCSASSRCSPRRWPCRRPWRSPP